DNYDIPHDSKMKFFQNIEKNEINVETNNMFEKLLLEISKMFPEQGLKYFFFVLDELFSKNHLKVIDFIPTEDLKEKINDLYFKLKQSFNRKGLESNEDSFIKRVLPFTQEKFPCSYQCSLDLLKIFKHYSGSSDDTKLLERPKTVEVLSENIIQCQEQIQALFPNPNLYFQSIENAFKRLKEVPVKYSLSKFKTVVEEISSSLGKKVAFDLQGEQSSMGQDKLTIVQETLLHLIRNSLDHGIEKPETRLGVGKVEAGQITLKIKKTDRGTDIILIDDGSGINIDKLMNKAIANGLVDRPDIDKMSEQEKIDFIFMPNLSTKEQVSEISGRGVGMDVVKKNIERLGGEINIKTVPGKSTEFYIIIPN
ncbi:MAG: ATP-binding protein, partial [Bdellovibrionota bacterium]|nr:ATP-binding protein [Bdellovibrionota bacterium]